MKIERKKIRHFLRLLCEVYLSQFGDSRRNLAGWKFSYTIVDQHKTLSDFVKNEVEKEVLEGKYVALMFEELKCRGFLDGAVNNQFSLSEVGYKTGTDNLTDITIGYLNQNPGIATIISILAFLVSVIALVVAYAKP